VYDAAGVDPRRQRRDRGIVGVVVADTVQDRERLLGGEHGRIVVVAEVETPRRRHQPIVLRAARGLVRIAEIDAEAREVRRTHALGRDGDGPVVYELKRPFRYGATHVCCTGIYECRGRQ
jgi:hypothetical protein